MANAIDILINATDNASSKIKGVGNSFSDLSGKAKKASTAIMGVLGATGIAIGAVAVAGFKMNSAMETSFAKWKTLTGSVKGANKQLDFIKQYAKDSPFDFEGVDQTATSLVGMGMSLQDVNKWIPTLGDMASVLGGGTETINGVGIALGQMNAKGKVSAEEMMQLSERGVNAWGMLADGMGLSVAEVQKLSSEGKILASDALPLIMAGMQKTFGGGTAEYMKTMKGQFDNLVEGATQFAGVLTKPVFDFFASSVLPALNSALEQLEAMFSGGLLQGFENLFNSKWAIPIVLLAGVITGALIGAIYLLAPAIMTAVVAFAPFIAIGVAVAGVVALIIGNWSKLAPFFNSIWQAILPFVLAFKETFMQTFQMLLTQLTPLWEAVKQLISSLMPVITAVGVIIGALLVVALAVFNGIVSAILPLVTAFLNLVSVVTNVVMAVVALLTGDWSGAMKYWNQATQASIDFCKNIWNALKGFFTGIWNTIVNIFAQFGVNVNQKVKDMWNKAKTATTTGINNMVNYIKQLPTKALVYFVQMSTKLNTEVKNGFNKAKSAVSTGITNMISAIKGKVSEFASSGKALLEAFAKGVKDGISKAVSAVKSGMENIRSFLPFSPAKKGPLKDLDKSGESFFPTWYEGALTQVSSMERAIGGAMRGLNSELENGNGMVELSAFTGGRSKITVVHSHEHKGTVRVNGDTGSQALSLVGKSMQETTETEVLGDLRQEFRKR